MTIEELTSWVEKHAGLDQRLTEIFARLEKNENLIHRAKITNEDNQKLLEYVDRQLFQIIRLCLKSKDPEKTLETVFSVAANTQRKIHLGN